VSLQHHFLLSLSLPSSLLSFSLVFSGTFEGLVFGK
jgi:hypothetical protein